MRGRRSICRLLLKRLVCGYAKREVSFDGALLRIADRLRGIVLVRKDIAEPARKRFTIAHEIGHNVLSGHGIPRRVCMEDQVGLLGTDEDGFEQAANRFAAELLLPAKEIAAIVSERGTSLDACKFVSKQFQTSLTASAIRCLEFSDTTAALVESRKGVLRSYKRSRRFKYFMTLSRELGSETLARHLSVVDEVEKKGLVPAWASVWIEAGPKLFEESILMPRYNTVLTLLTES
jgi:Zn-dependent peptidase ImmA (M78 family)